MAMRPTANINVVGFVPLISPRQLKRDLPATEEMSQVIFDSREAAKAILSGTDDRMLVVLGPCSIHNRDAALEYAERLKGLSDKVSDRLLLVMRVYFEKPRTTLGWKGLINDPHLDGSFDMVEGLHLAREILLKIVGLGLPTATETLEPFTPQYLDDLITLASVGARTTESPTHRQMASGLSMPVGFKNGTDGSLDVAINAMTAAAGAHSFLGMDDAGGICIVQTKGNDWGHLILRGGRSGPNHTPDALARAAKKLRAAGFPARLMVDCSHGNSRKDHHNQPKVWEEVVEQRLGGNKSIIGMMLESHLKPGRQDLGDAPSQLEYGLSITDACIGWEETAELVLATHERLGQVVTG